MLYCALMNLLDSGDTVLFILGDNFFQYDPIEGFDINQVVNESGAYIFSS